MLEDKAINTSGKAIREILIDHLTDNGWVHGVCCNIITIAFDDNKSLNWNIQLICLTNTIQVRAKCGGIIDSIEYANPNFLDIIDEYLKYDKFLLEKVSEFDSNRGEDNE